MTANPAVHDHYRDTLALGMAPINRWGKPQEVTLAVGAIACGHYPFSTGTVFHIDAGWHLHEL